jgi:hypothetical protein
MPRLRSLALAAIVALGAATACDEPIIHKPLAEVKQAEVEAALEKLGWKVADPSSGEVEADEVVSGIRVTGSRESGRGKTAADGVKRVYLTVVIRRIPAALRTLEIKRLRGEGAVHVDGDRVMSVRYTPRDYEDPAMVMNKLFAR